MRVNKVEYVDGYKLKLRFSDHTTKIVDMEPIIKKSKRVFLPLKDIEYFKKVSLDDRVHPLSICWPNGADMCPDLLYDMGKEIKAPSKQKSTVIPQKRPSISRKARRAMSRSK